MSFDTAHGSDGGEMSQRQSLLRWFLVLAKASGEEVARANLARQGYAVYCPRLLRRKLYRGRYAERVVPLFPRYLFVQLDTSCQALAPVRSTLGIVDIVRFGSKPALVPDSIVEDLRGRADVATGLHRLHAQALEHGAAVSVIGGVFAGLDGIFEREAGEQRVVVLLRLLGQETAVRVPSGFICPRVAV
jgi:transcriptional antiterminator RfaH